MELTISGNNRKGLEEVEDLAKKLGLDVSYKKKGGRKTKENQKHKKAVEAMQKLAEMGAFKSIDDPVAWQREQRKDRDIGRDE